MMRAAEEPLPAQRLFRQSLTDAATALELA
jgi:hypothetical protein